MNYQNKLNQSIYAMNNQMNDFSYNQQNNDYKNYMNNCTYLDSGNFTELSIIDVPKDERQKKIIRRI